MFDVTVQSPDLSAVLGTAQRMVASKPTLPILGNVLLRASKDALHISATDTEIGFLARIKASSAESGEVTISARLLHELVRSFSISPVRIQAKDATAVAITAAGFKGKLSTIPPDDFPSLPEPPKGDPCAIPRGEFRDALARVKFAMTPDDTRFFLNGAKIEPSEGAFRLVATDAHRLAICDAKRLGAGGEAAILPRKTCEILASLLDNSKVDLVLYTRGENHLFFHVGESVVISRVIAGEYPNYKLIIPPQAEQEAELDRVLFLSTLRRIAAVADPTTHKVKFALSKGVLTVSSKGTVGDADEEVAANYEGADVHVGLQINYVMDFLETAGTDSVALGIIGPEKGVSFTALSGSLGYRYIVMPMSLQE